MREILLFVFASFLMMVPASAQSSPECSSDDVSRKVEKQAQKWEKRAQKREFGRADRILMDIEKALANGSYNACETERVLAAQKRVGVWSGHPEIAMPALEQSLENTSPETNPTWQLQVDKLSRLYREAGRFEELKQLSQKHLGPYDTRETSVLEQSLVLAHVGLDETEQAFSLIVDKAANATQQITRWDLLFGYALAVRTGRTADAELFKSVADSNFGGLRLPGPLPLVEGDDLANLLARETDPAYQIKVIKPPKPSYPGRAAERGIQGVCDVHMDVGTDGKPMNIRAYCSNELFVQASERAAKGMRFEPLQIDGQTYVMTDFVYPLEFSLA